MLNKHCIYSDRKKNRFTGNGQHSVFEQYFVHYILDFLNLPYHTGDFDENFP